jgi:transposase
MSFKFILTDRETPYLLPPSIQEWLPENHLARFVSDIVAQLDLRSLKNGYAGRGSKAYNPEMMVALLFYGYATGVFASRQLERVTYDSVAFRYISANKHPDHDTIADFRKRFLPQLKPLFVQILTIAGELKVLKLGKVSLDGSKIKANASKHHALSWQHAEKLERQLKAEVEELLRQAEAADAADVPDGMDIPDELARRQKRLEAIAGAKEEISRRAQARYTREKAEYERKMVERKEEEESSAKKAKGKKFKPPEAGPKPIDQVNLTDSESRIMPASGGGFNQAYNVQASVEVDSMLIVENHISQQVNDKRELEASVRAIAALPAELGKLDTILADNGYFSKSNVEFCEEQSIIPLIAMKRDQHNLPLRDRFAEPPPIPGNADAVAKMRQRLMTQGGRRLYAKRKSTVEPVFGIIKAIMKFRQFMLRGLEAVRGEWDLVCIAWNLKRLHVLVA